MRAEVSFKQNVDSIIGSKSLLKHPFYVAWTEGKLSKDQLRQYAEQYFHNVLAEPTYLSAIHFNTPHLHTETNSGDISVRQEVLKNLISEEYGEKKPSCLVEKLLPLLWAQARRIWPMQQHCLARRIWLQLFGIFA